MNSALIVFRTDASLDIGTGHVMRCLTLAAALSERGATCQFVCRAHQGNLIEFVRERGYQVHTLPQGDDGTSRLETLAHAHWLGASWEHDAEQTVAALNGQKADWLVVDHYALDQRWEFAMRRRCNKLMAIDDLADRVHDCDLLLDQNLGRMHSDYAALVPARSTVLTGPRYALLRPEFAATRPYSLQRRAVPALRRLLITMGGVDRDNATGKVLEALRVSALPADYCITIVMGPHAPWLEQVKRQAAGMACKAEVLVNVKDMWRLMADSDLAIGAGGGTSWERCALGLPSILVVQAVNQEVVAASLEQIGAVRVLGGLAQIVSNLPRELARLQQPGQLSEMAAAAASITDGLGLERLTGVLEA